ncbi:hypothetical protein ACJJTC_018158 [Scirpophaga incertulas]
MVSFFILLAVCVGVHALPNGLHPLKDRDAIFNDERLSSQTFKNDEVFRNPYRLPGTTVPAHYSIRWKVTMNPSAMAFSGTVDIDFRATQSNVKEIVLNSDGLNIESLKLQLDKKVINQTHSFDERHQFLIVKLQSGHLKYNKDHPKYYKLSISFNSTMRTDGLGIYSISYTSNGNVHWMAATLFREIFARTAFPCFDEPALKATFDITISRPANYKSWSNMQIHQTKASVDVGYEDDVYYTTRVMPAYSVAFIVSEYESITKSMSDGEKMYEVIARPDAVQSGLADFTFAHGYKALQALKEYTDMDYNPDPFSKMTLVAIPDAGNGADSWGLPAYKEMNFIYDKVNSSKEDKHYVTPSITHELVHQWFGNLVTLDYWNVYWLNEGVATFFEIYISDMIEETQAYTSSFIVDQLNSALLTDASDFSSPLNNFGVGNPDTIDSMASVLTYYKGGSIVRMTDHLMGSENHRHAFRKYLKERQFKTATPMDLFCNFQESALETGAIAEYGPDFSIIEYYKSWTDQAGHPVLDVDIDRQNGKMNIQQRRFHVVTGYSAVESVWFVPITFATASNPDFLNTKPTHIINKSHATLDLSIGTDEWIILNKQNIGFYRVNYDDHSWDLIAQLLSGPDRELVHEYNRAKIVMDVFHFARSGIMTYTKAYHILSFLKYETAYTVWRTAIDEINWIFLRIVNTTNEGPFKKMVLEWASLVMSDIGYVAVENESYFRSDLRIKLASTLCIYEDKNCRNAAKKQFEDLYNQGIEVPLESRDWVYCNGLRDGGPEYFQFLWERQLNHPQESEKKQILTTLGCTNDEGSLNRLLDAIVNDQKIVPPDQLLPTYNIAVIGNEVNTQRVFRYIQEHMKAVKNRFQSYWLPFAYVSSRLRSVEDVIQFENWAAQNKEELGDDYFDVSTRCSNSVELIGFGAKVHDDMQNFFRSHESSQHRR